MKEEKKIGTFLEAAKFQKKMMWEKKRWNMYSCVKRKRNGRENILIRKSSQNHRVSI